MHPSERIWKWAKTEDEGNSQSALLPTDTQSACPERVRVLDATIHEANGCVFMSKRCPDHGPYHEPRSSDARFFTLMIGREMSAGGSKAALPSPWNRIDPRRRTAARDKPRSHARSQQ